MGTSSDIFKRNIKFFKANKSLSDLFQNFSETRQPQIEEIFSDIHRLNTSYCKDHINNPIVFRNLLSINGVFNGYSWKCVHFFIDYWIEFSAFQSGVEKSELEFFYLTMPNGDPITYAYDSRKIPVDKFSKINELGYYFTNVLVYINLKDKELTKLFDFLKLSLPVGTVDLKKISLDEGFYKNMIGYFLISRTLEHTIRLYDNAVKNRCTSWKANLKCLDSGEPFCMEKFYVRSPLPRILDGINLTENWTFCLKIEYEPLKDENLMRFFETVDLDNKYIKELVLKDPTQTAAFFRDKWFDSASFTKVISDLSVFLANKTSICGGMVDSPYDDYYDYCYFTSTNGKSYTGYILLGCDDKLIFLQNIQNVFLQDGTKKRLFLTNFPLFDHPLSIQKNLKVEMLDVSPGLEFLRKIGNITSYRIKIGNNFEILNTHCMFSLSDGSSLSQMRDCYTMSLRSTLILKQSSLWVFLTSLFLGDRQIKSESEHLLFTLDFKDFCHKNIEFFTFGAFLWP